MGSADPGRPRERAINLPPLILWSVVVLLAIQALREVLPDEADLALILDGAFVPAPWSVALGWASPADVVAAALPGVSDPDRTGAGAALARFLGGPWAAKPWSWLTYAGLHGSWTHVGLNGLWLAAFGPPVLRRAGPGRFLLVCLLAAPAGCLAQWLASPLSVQPMIGASAVVSGLMAAAATFIFERPRPSGPGHLPAAAPSLARWGFLRDRSAILFLSAWLAVNLLFGLAAQPLGFTESPIAWEAHLGGLVAGLALFPLLDPGRDAARTGPRTALPGSSLAKARPDDP